ncbi:lipopolysaccharide biosynthesis protein [Salinicoccus roseus]|uniref:lipopolysaccharide biosynthesis protein n=1 Tax=Salinicoccus roseus TaxID=45670 RepID=UPI0035636736
MLKYLFNYVPAKVLPGLINLASIMIYSRIFSQQDYGEFSYIVAIGALLQGIFFPWIRMSLSRFIHEYEESDEKRLFLNNIYNLHYFISIGASVILVLLYFITNNFYFLLIVMLISTSSTVELVFANLRSEFLVRKFAAFSIIRSVFKLLLTVFFAYLMTNGTYSLIFGAVLTNVLIIISLRKFTPSLSFKKTLENREAIKQFLGYGLPLTFTFLMTIILSSIDRVFIRNYLGLNEVAEYTLAYDFSSFITTNIIMIINLAYYPIIMRSYTKKLNYQIRLLEYNKLIFLFSSSLLIILITNSKFISQVVFGDQYNVSTMSYIVIIISISAFISSLKSFYFDIVFHISKNTKLQIIPIVVAALINIVLNWIFIPIFELKGALYATLISYLISLILSILIGRKILKIPLLNRVGMASIFFITGLPLILNTVFENENLYKLSFTIVIVLIIYVSLMFIMERKLITRIIKGNILD